MTIKAVIFDIGGVCVGSPMAGIHRYETHKGLPRNYINVAIVSQGENGAFQLQKLERGEIKLDQFYKEFGTQLSNPMNKEHYKNYLAKSGRAIPDNIPDVSVDGKELFTIMMLETAKLDSNIYLAIQKLKASKRYKLAALTNNFELPEDDLREAEALGASATEKLRKLFDYFIESRLIGLRKPDPKIYHYACNEIGVQPEEVIFLDDIGMNLRSASSLGMKTIRKSIIIR